LLCVMDDAQLLDGASGQVFGFVARRILAESVVVLSVSGSRARIASWWGCRS